MAFYHHRSFVRPEGEEEITPPCIKTRSFDSLSVAAILQGKLDPTAASAGFGATPPTSTEHSVPPSPTIDAAAAVLASASRGTNEQNPPSSRAAASKKARGQSGINNAADCLLSLAGLFGGPADRPNLECDRPAADGSAAKRRLKMARSSALSSKPYSPPASGAGSHARGAARNAKQPQAAKSDAEKAASRAAAATVRRAAAGQARQQQQQQQQQRSRPRAGVAPAAPAGPAVMRVVGMPRPVQLLSGASLYQLKLLAAAYKLCPTPTAEQLNAIAHRVGVTPAKLEAWFVSRKTLEEWVVGQPHLTPVDIAKMFFEHHPAVDAA